MHLVTTHAASARAGLIARIGEEVTRALYSIVSAIGLALIVYGFARYRADEWIEVWSPPDWTKHLAALLVLFAMIMLVAAYARGHIYIDGSSTRCWPA